MVLASFSPMLAGTIKDLANDAKKFNWPLVASPKLDGIRTLLHPEKGAVSRSLTPIPNRSTREAFSKVILPQPRFLGLDGELMDGTVGSADKDIFNRSTSAIMSHGGEPKLLYWVFDTFHPDWCNKTYTDRMAHISLLGLEEATSMTGGKITFQQLPSLVVANIDALLEYEDECLKRGFEGVMLRDASRTYKFGRSSISKTSQHLMKLKRMADAEAQVIGFEELMHNNNMDIKDNMGYAKRSTQQAGMVPANTLGALVVEGTTGPYKGKVFKLGSGFDMATRDKIWQNQELHCWQIVTYKYQECGSIDAPRFPVYKCFRKD